MPFTPEQAREAGKKSAAKRAAKREAERRANELATSQGTSSATSQGDRGVAPGGMGSGRGGSSAADGSQTDHAIVRELERRAQQGDIAAARELREWRRLDPAESADKDALRLAASIVQLSAATRSELRSWLQKALQPDGFEAGTQDGFDAALAVGQPVGTGHPRSDGSHRDARGSRPPEEESTPPTASADGSHTPDGTDSRQMTVDECIAEAERGPDKE